MAASALIFILIAGAIGVTLWRYESALDRYQHDALAARSNAETVEKAMSAFWQEQTAIFSYVTQQSWVPLANIELARTTFVSLLKTLHTTTAEEDALRVQALGANRKAYVNFVKRVRPALSGTSGNLVAALEQQKRLGNAVIPPLNELTEFETTQADQAVSEAQDAGNEALIAGADRRRHHPPRGARFRPLCPPADRLRSLTVNADSTAQSRKSRTESERSSICSTACERRLAFSPRS